RSCPTLRFPSWPRRRRAGSTGRKMLFEAQVELFLGPIHVLFEVLFPDARPGAAEHIRDLELDHLAGRDLRRVSADRIERARALRPAEPIRRVPAFLEVAMPEDAHRLRERLRIVDHGFPVEPDEFSARVLRGGQDLDRLELVAELPRGVLRPR